MQLLGLFFCFFLFNVGFILVDHLGHGSLRGAQLAKCGGLNGTIQCHEWRRIEYVRFVKGSDFATVVQHGHIQHLNWLFLTWGNGCDCLCTERTVRCRYEKTWPVYVTCHSKTISLPVRASVWHHQLLQLTTYNSLTLCTITSHVT